MDVSALVIFATTLFFVGAAPGPSIAALVARVLARGWRDVVPFLAAFWIGELIWLTFTIAGLAAIAESFHWAFVIVKYCGVAYLLYLAWRMWTAPVQDEIKDLNFKPKNPARMFFSGLAITLGNPKIMAFYLALLPTIIDLGGITFSDWATLAMVCLIVIITIDSTYVALAVRARTLLINKKARRVANRVSATVMGGAAAVIATR